MTVYELAQWLLSQPMDVLQGDMNSIVNGHVFGAKRLVSFRNRDGSGAGVYVESMGTHISDEQGSVLEIVDSIPAHGLYQKKKT